MKAVINVHPKSGYAKYNGLTFGVKEVLTSVCGVVINGAVTDFSHKEIIIVDIIEELKIATENKRYDENTYLNLNLYILKNKIQIPFQD